MNVETLKKISFKLLILVLAIIMLYTAIISKDFYGSTINTLHTWLYKVMPPIFNFYIIISILIKYNILNKIFIIFKPLNKILQFDSPDSINLFMLSILVGNPSFSVFLKSYYLNKKISDKDHIRLFKCCSFQTPLFIFSLFPNNLNIAIILICSSFFSSFLLCLKTKKCNLNSSFVNSITPHSLTSYNDIFYSASLIVITIASVMVFFNSIIISLNYFKIPKIATIFLEISNGIFYLLNSNYSYLIKMSLISFLLSFNCLAIHMQIFCNNKNIKYSSFFIFRIFHGTLSAILTYLTLYIVTSLTP